MRAWLDKSYTGKPLNQVSDQIAIALDSYEWALRKHGLKSTIGSLGNLIDPKFLAGTTVVGVGLAATGTEFLAALATTAVFSTRLALTVSSHLLEAADLRRGPNSEVCFLYDVRRVKLRTPSLLSRCQNFLTRSLLR